MNCIREDLIQKYIDRETTCEEDTLVENHIISCNKCVQKIETQRRLATNVKNAINLLTKGTIEIPNFEITSNNIKKHSVTTKRLNYIFAAACILFMVIFITKKKEMKNKDEIKFEIGSVIDVDANRPVTKFPLVINIIDADGNISEYFIK